MTCKECNHEIRDHKWNFDNKPEPCEKCDYKDYNNEDDLK